MFINSDQKILSQEEIIEKLRLEIVSLIHERDSLILWNGELMRWKNEIYSASLQKSNELYTTESTIEETKKTLNETSLHFINLTENQREIIKNLDKSIENRIKELSNQEWKQLINFDWENIKIKERLKEKRQELQIVIDDIKEKEMEKEKIEFYINEQLQYIKQEKEYLIEYRSNLELREKDIRIKEKRLTKKLCQEQQ